MDAFSQLLTVKRSRIAFFPHNLGTALVAMALLWFGIALPATAQQDEILITEDTTIDAGNTDFQGRSIRVDGAKLFLQGEYDFYSLTLENGAVVRPPSGVRGESSRIELTVEGEVRVDGSSRINVSGHGLGQVDGQNGDAGGSHGGRGGRDSWSTGYPSLAVYGDYQAPSTMGQGGTSGAYGGGVFKLTADTLELHGVIEANGTTGNRAGGAGGSVWLDVGTMTASEEARIEANGAGGDGIYDGGGGGGRIAIYHSEDSVPPGLDVLAKGGSGSGNTGGPGTVYWENKGTGENLLRVDNGVAREAQYARISTLHDDLTRLEVSGARLKLGKQEEVLSPRQIATVEVDNGTLELLNIESITHLDLKNEAVLRPLSGVKGEAAALRFVSDKVVVDASSRINVSGHGLGQVDGQKGDAGGSHGGRGGRDSWSTGYPSLAVYGDYQAPSTMGQGGTSGAYGGGVFKLTADTLELHGVIEANGTTGNRAGGAGGSVWLDVGTMTASEEARIEANGAGGDGIYDGGGGGGRIAIYHSEDSVPPGLDVLAKGGSGSGNTGGPGTVYWENKGTGENLLRVDNGVAREAQYARISTLHDDLTRLEVSGARLKLGKQEEVLSPRQIATVEVDNGTLELLNIESITHLDLKNEAVLRPLSGVKGEASALKLVSHKVVVDASSRINVSGHGLGRVDGQNGDAGGSHGGRGGRDSWSTGYPSLAVYGDYQAPSTMGQGGTSGAYGGGVFKLTADTLELHGVIEANGTTGNRAGGAGGSVWLDVGTMTASEEARIEANGAGGDGIYDGSGGGGRVAVYYDTFHGSWSGFISVQGGTDNNVGSAGTVFRNDRSASSKRLIIRNTSGGSRTWSEVTSLSEGTSDLSVDLYGRVRFLGEDYAIKSLELHSGAILKTRRFDESTEEGGRLSLAAEYFSIDSDARLSVSSLGQGHVDGQYRYVGGSHGGRGGNDSWSSGQQSLAAYGDAEAPTTLGQGGNGGAYGGGAFKLTVETLELNGVIEANGTSSRSGGAGGSLWLDVGTLTAAEGAMVEARGAAGTDSYGGSGGGGRIAIDYGTALDFNEQTMVSAAGGTAGNPGEDGSIVINRVPQTTRIVQTSLESLMVDSIETIDLHFATEIDPATLSASDVSLFGANLGSVSIADINALNKLVYRVTLTDPVPEGSYVLEVGPDIQTPDGLGMDQNRDGDAGTVSDVYQFSFEIDDTRPPQPVLTSHDATATIKLDGRHIVLEGKRTGEDPVAIWLDDGLRVVLGTDNWQVEQDLAEGSQSLELKAVNEAGIASEPVVLDINVDSIAPRVDGITQASHANEIPGAVGLLTTDNGSGISLADSDIQVLRDGNPVTGDLQLKNDRIEFTPATPFTEGAYQVQASVADNRGNTTPPDGQQTFDFALDTTAPNPVVLDDYPDHTTINAHNFSGQREEHATILVDGEAVQAEGDGTTWQTQVPLEEGDNTVSFRQRDRAGNVSEPVTADIFYNSEAPGPVEFQADVEGNGTTVDLAWPDYDEFENGNDIAEYRIFVESEPFDSVEGLTHEAEVPAGEKAYELGGLSRDGPSYVAVVARDIGGLMKTEVSGEPLTPVDVVSPEKPSDLQVNVGSNQLGLSWIPSEDPHDDLAGYRIRVQIDGEQVTHELANDEVSLSDGRAQYVVDGLTPATAHPLSLTAFDLADNESGALSDEGVTLLSNPDSVSAEGRDGRIALEWPASQPSELVDGYRLYVAEQPFTSVEGMDPERNVDATTLASGVAGLDNGTTYHAAVTARNLSGGENPSVDSVEVTPEEDTEGPTIEGLVYQQVDGTQVDLMDGGTITRDGTLHLKASDDSGLSRAEFRLGSEILGSSLTANPDFSIDLELFRLDDGDHTLDLRVFDNHSNETQETRPLTIDLAPPEPPVIDTPSDGHVTNNESVEIAGTADDHTQVQLTVNGTVLDANSSTSNGRFSAEVPLEEGDNSIRAQAAYSSRNEYGVHSDPIEVTLDNTVPDAPAGLSATGRAQGEVRLSWSAPDDDRIQGYHLYRSTAPFTAVAEAQRITQEKVRGERYTDLPDEDGTYHYRAVAVNELGTESDPSPSDDAVSDSEAPYVKNVEFDPEGGHDPENNRFGPGRVNLDLEFNEALETTPYLAFTVSGGNPIVVELQPDYNDEKSYKGHFVIPEDTRSGTAYGVLSARDEVGNRGSNMLDGESIVIDAQGPEVSDIVTNPVDPIRNEIGDNGEGQVIGIEMRLSEPVASGASPTLVPMLKEDAGDAIIPGYDSGLTLALDEEASTPEEPVYTTELQLPHDAGLDEQGEPGIAYLHFDYSAVDDLGTEATGIDGDPRFQVYQGDLPPTDIPEGLKARALEGGIVELSWDEVEDAAGYVVYRQGPNESELSEVTELSNPAEPLYLDGKPDGLDDGTYQYALASVRSHQGEQSRSAQSEVVEVEAMGTPPEAPEEFALELAGNGVVAQWMHPAVASSDSEVTYNLYRFALAADQPAPDLADETPLQADIPEPIAVDTEPSESEHYYVVTAVDKAGNESAPSNSDYLDSDLLPVSELAISIPEEGRPVLTWKHQNANLSGFEVGYLDSNQETVPLHDDLITETAFTDPDYADGESLSGAPKDRTYQVVAVNTDGQRSVANTLELPALSMELLDEQDSAIERGVMNRLNYRVTNAGDEEVVQARLRVGVEVDGEVREHWSKRFSVEAGDYTDVPVVIGGYEELGSHATLDAEIVLEPSPGHLLSIQQEQSAGVGQSGVRLDVETEEMVRGADGKARLVLENTSDVEMEIVTARNNGNDPSDQIRLVLKDRDGNVLSSQAAKQATGSVVTNASGDTVARIAPGDTFESQAFDVLAPMSSPEDARLHLEVDQFHHQLGRDTAVSIGGSRASSDVSLRETSYYAELESVEPQTVFTGETVTLEGRALDRDTDEPLSSVPVNLVLDVRGFERTFELQTRSDGTFSHSFTPGSGEAGSYRVSALHPSVTDRPDHGSFLVEGAGVSPTRAELEFPRNYDYRLDVKVRADKGSDLNNVRLEHAPQQDAEGNDMPLPDGLNLDLAGPLTIAGGERATLGMVISGTQQAPEQGTVRAHVMADNSEDPLDTVKVDYYLTEAKPRLQAQPTHLETGISHDGEQRETFTITNDGLESAENLSLELQDNQGNPAPDWLNLLSPSDLGNLEVDESTDIQLRLEPTSEVAEGNHEFRLRLEGDNAQALDIPVFASVTQSGEGNVLFHAVDIHTATLDEDGEPIPGLADAQITLQHQETLDETKVETDVNGEALVEDLAPGRYTYRASAFDHESTSGEIEVRPGITRREQVYLNNQLIQMEFSVKEITIEDRYDIVLESTFETDVPAPVVVFEPASVNLPMLEKGEVFQGEFTLSNHGQVEAENVNASLPEGDEYARFEYLTEIPEVLAPGQVVVVPYRITALKDFLPEADGSASGGGCVKHQYEAACDYSFECAVGTFVRNAARLLFNAVGGSSCESSTSSGGIGGGSGFVGGYGGGGGGGTTYTPRGGTPIEPKDSACEDNSCSSGSCQCSQGGGD